MPSPHDSFFIRTPVEKLAQSIADAIDGDYDDDLEVHWAARALGERVVITLTDVETKQTRGFQFDVEIRPTK